MTSLLLRIDDDGVCFWAVRYIARGEDIACLNIEVV